MYALLNGVNTEVESNGDGELVAVVPGGMVPRNPFESRSVKFVSLDESRAKQAFKDECDINTLVERFGLGYEMPRGLRIPRYGDFSEVTDYHSAANALAAARESFDALPAHVRARFQNDPGAFVDFCSDDANEAEMLKMGLIEPLPKDNQVVTKSEVPAPGPAPGVTPDASAPKATV